MKKTLSMLTIVAALTGCELFAPTYAYLDPDDPVVQQLVALNTTEPAAAALAFEKILKSQGLPASVERLETKVDTATGKIDEVRAVVTPGIMEQPEVGTSALTELIPNPAARTIVEALLGLLVGGQAAVAVRKRIKRKYPKKPK